MKVLILGSTGLLGNTIARYFFNNHSYETFAIIRDSSKISYFNKKFHKNFFILNDLLDFEELEMKIKEIKPDILINCLGITNKIFRNDSKFIENYIYINSLFPHKLYQRCLDLNIRLIHFSTDCVFSGKKGFYSEKDLPDSSDIYGRSKLLGELDYDDCITIRKSVIGHEVTSKNGLLEWFLDQRKLVQGYKNVIFSGLTSLELAWLIDEYVIPRNDLKGVLHFSGETISKFELLKIIREIYNKKIDIVINEDKKIDRSLNGSKFNKLTGYKVKSWPKLIKSMYEFQLLNK